jgi:hypothetical protein
MSTINKLSGGEAVRSDDLLASRFANFVETSDMLAREDDFDSSHANIAIDPGAGTPSAESAGGAK